MRLAILDACFPISNQSGRGMAAEYLSWELKRNKMLESPIEDADILLVTCASTMADKFLKSLRKKYPKKIIIAGGPASTSPYTLGKYCDAVCVGDGQKFIQTLTRDGFDAATKLDNVWIDGESRMVNIDQNFPWDLPPIKAEDGAVRVWCGRGCKNKCLFCQTGWAYTYSENPDPDKLLRQIALLQKRGEKISYLSNDIAQHSFYKRLPPTIHGSFSVNYLKKNGLPMARQIRLGIEGVSSRLRTMVKKPISNDDLIKCTSWLNKNGKSVRWFLIAGLPGETWEDWEELQNIILQWKEITPKGVLALSFTAWCPDPATPLALQPLQDDYWEYFTKFKEWFFGGIGWSNKIKILNPQQPAARLQKAIKSMGLSETQLRKGGCKSPNKRVAYPFEYKST